MRRAQNRCRSSQSPTDCERAGKRQTERWASSPTQHESGIEVAIEVSPSGLEVLALGGGFRPHAQRTAARNGLPHVVTKGVREQMVKLTVLFAVVFLFVGKG